MKLCLVLFLLLCCGTLHMGSGLTCCTDKDCKQTEECGTKDACLALTPSAGQSTRRCINYSQCGYSTLAPMFPNIGEFTFKCCQRNLCNSGNAVTMATPILALIGCLLSTWWGWL